MKKPKDPKAANAAADMTRERKPAGGRAEGEKRRSRPVRQMELPGTQTDQDRLDELEMLNSRALGRTDDAGAGGAGDAVGVAVAADGPTGRTGGAGGSGGSGESRSLDRMRQAEDELARNVTVERTRGRPRGSAVRGRAAERAIRGKAGGAEGRGKAGGAGKATGSDGGDDMAMTHRRGRPAGSRNEPVSGRSGEPTGGRKSEPASGRGRNEPAGRRGGEPEARKTGEPPGSERRREEAGSRGPGTRASRGRNPIRGTRGTGAATLERPATARKPVETDQPGQGGFTIELRKRRKSPRMGKVVLKPTPVFDADEIRDIRLRLRMSQMSFADLLGVSVKAVEAWEAGRNRPGGPALRLMDLYVTNPDLIPFG